MQILRGEPAAKLLLCAPQGYSADLLASALAKAGVKKDEMMRLADPRHPPPQMKHDVFQEYRYFCFFNVLTVLFSSCSFRTAVLEILDYTICFILNRILDRNVGDDKVVLKRSISGLALKIHFYFCVRPRQTTVNGFHVVNRLCCSCYIHVSPDWLLLLLHHSE